MTMLSVPAALYPMEWTTIMEFIPVPDLFVELDTLRVSNPMINQFLDEYRQGIYMNFEYTYTGYSYEHNQEYNCYWGAQYCFYMNSPFYTYKNIDEFDYRFVFVGMTPFYADYTGTLQKIVFDGSKARPEPWEKIATEYAGVGKIRF
jgi:hypothetical protein